LCCKNLAKTPEHLGSNLEVATAPFSRFFITSTPNYRWIGILSLGYALTCCALILYRWARHHDGINRPGAMIKR
jgi:hypothetical protein